MDGKVVSTQSLDRTVPLVPPPSLTPSDGEGLLIYPAPMTLRAISGEGILHGPHHNHRADFVDASFEDRVAASVGGIEKREASRRPCV